MTDSHTPKKLPYRRKNSAAPRANRRKNSGAERQSSAKACQGNKKCHWDDGAAVTAIARKRRQITLMKYAYDIRAPNVSIWRVKSRADTKTCVMTAGRRRCRSHSVFMRLEDEGKLKTF